MTSLVLFGLFGCIILSIVVTLTVIAIIRNSPRLYLRFIMNQKPVHVVCVREPSLASINAELAVQKRKMAVAGLDAKVSKLNGSVASLTPPVV